MPWREGGNSFVVRKSEDMCSQKTILCVYALVRERIVAASSQCHVREADVGRQLQRYIIMVVVSATPTLKAQPSRTPSPPLCTKLQCPQGGCLPLVESWVYLSSRPPSRGAATTRARTLPLTIVVFPLSFKLSIRLYSTPSSTSL
eukprot:SAG11_NODE_9729_length_885_cov_1.199746_1_plen_145_part_00